MKEEIKGAIKIRVFELQSGQFLKIGVIGIVFTTINLHHEARPIPNEMRE